MPELLITELSRASGFPSSALRYYERVGLLSPVGRSEGGYRLYDERAIDRLAFISRAKRLGLSLEEIGALVELWDDGPCAPVQTRLSAMVDEKVAGLDAQIDELGRFRVQLAHVQRAIASVDTSADRCGPGCGCDSELLEPAAIECTLDGDDVPERLREWTEVLDRVRARELTATGVRLRFPRDAALLAALADLAAREVGCCAFFTFALMIDAAGAWLAVDAPAEARQLVIDVFGA